VKEYFLPTDFDCATDQRDVTSEPIQRAVQCNLPLRGLALFLDDALVLGREEKLVPQLGVRFDAT
jgi:hypothetical protein